MATNKVPGYRQINGSFGQVWWDGELIFEVSSFSAEVTANREKVQMAGSLDEDSKITSLSGEGTLKIKHVFTRGCKKFLDAWKSGKDPRSQFVGKLADPDTKDSGAERIVFNNVWFNKLTLMEFETGKVLEREFPFGYTPSDVDFPDTIPVQEG
ncbi:MAG: phage tail tube protein [Syntrophomonadaceae bacterium]|nr:phage tail tube protein [Syntrophomonadaceae bacterium]